MTATFAGLEISGTKMRARTPSRLAAKATAAPWLPPDAAATPAAGTGFDRRVLKAPLVLNEPACCRNSSFRLTGPSWPNAFGRVQTGVRRIWGAMRAWAASISAREMGMGLGVQGRVGL